MTRKIPRPYRDPYRPVPRDELRLHAAQSWWVLPGSLSELVTSVRKEGIQERIRVQRLGRRKYCIIDGKKRWQAAHYADMTHVPITIVDNMKNEDADTVWLSEYCRDRALPIVDLALTVFEFSRLFRGHYQQREIAQLVGCWPPPRHHADFGRAAPAARAGYSIPELRVASQGRALPEVPLQTRTPARRRWRRDGGGHVTGRCVQGGGETRVDARTAVQRPLCSHGGTREVTGPKRRGRTGDTAGNRRARERRRRPPGSARRNR